jgi:hypothetical protein
MMRLSRDYLGIVVLIVGVTFCLGHAYGGEEGGGQAGAFLRLPVGARACGMGDAFTAVSDDVDAMYYNPAGMYQVNSAAGGVSVAIMSMDRHHYHASFVYSSGAYGAVGVNFIGFGVSDIDGRDNTGFETGSFEDNETALALGYSYKVFRYLGFGVGIKYIQHSLADAKADGIGFDAGLHSRVTVNSDWFRSIRLGASLSNIGADLEWDTEAATKEDIPTTLRLGCAAEIEFTTVELLGAIDVSRSADESAEFHAGLESWFSDVVAARIGFDSDHVNFGGAIEYKRFRFDYAYAPDVLEEGATSKLGIQFEM